MRRSVQVVRDSVRKYHQLT